MHMKLPEVKRCCFCLPLRKGIIIFGCINILLTLFATACLFVTTELRKSTITNGSSLEVVTSTVLFSILGMAVILNILLLVAGCQKDATMFRLYNFYGIASVLATLIPTFILLSRLQTLEACVTFSAIVMQCYVIVLVRSEILKLEKQTKNDLESASPDVVDVPDRDTLL
ncbi:uncharacterized protein LOC113512718 [Galleria mellonella]|uniref:Uncharacterized protein LOC113512718 n=1 Tax=Galleria mellonella TaxID=7137 RepID=A0A6J1WLY9_GALME|nr:uncharacterized protein LOC113512718 [Galleria mellonella]